MGFRQSSGGGVGVLLLGDGEYVMISSWVRNKDGVGGGRPVGRSDRSPPDRPAGHLHSAIVHPQWVSVLPDGEKDECG